MRFIPALAVTAMACDDVYIVAKEQTLVDCGRALPCEWSVLEGNAAIGPSWHDGDFGLDLSSPGRVVVEHRQAPFALSSSQLVLGAVVIADGATMRVEIEWFVAGSGGPRPAATYWDRAPVKLGTSVADLSSVGVRAVEAPVSPSNLQVSGLVLRIVKEGQGTAIIDNISLRQPRPQR